MERKRLLQRTAVLALIFTMSSPRHALSGAQSANGDSQDEAAVRSVVKNYVEAREQKDPRATEALFTADADQLVSSGEWRKGRDAVVRGTMASSQQTGGTRSITVESVRFLAPGVAIADGRYELRGLTGGKTRRMWTAIIVTREKGSWKIAAIRNMLPAAPAPTR
jgi:uncharacterized protein (TIGR02246 family)